MLQFQKLTWIIFEAIAWHSKRLVGQISCLFLFVKSHCAQHVSTACVKPGHSICQTRTQLTWQNLPRWGPQVRDCFWLPILLWLGLTLFLGEAIICCAAVPMFLCDQVMMNYVENQGHKTVGSRLVGRLESEAKRLRAWIFNCQHTLSSRVSHLHVEMLL